MLTRVPAGAAKIVVKPAARANTIPTAETISRVLALAANELLKSITTPALPVRD